MKPFVLALSSLLLMAAVASPQDQPSPQQQAAPFRAVPLGQPYYAPQVQWAPRQNYAIVPTQPGAMMVPYPCYCPPRGVWGIGPFPLGYYW